MHPFTSVLDNVSEIRKVFQHSTRWSPRDAVSHLGHGIATWAVCSLHELSRWLRMAFFQEDLFDPCSYNATTFSKQTKYNITVHGRLLEYIGVHDVGLVSTTASWHPQIISNPTCSERFTPRPSIWLMGQHWWNILEFRAARTIGTASSRARL